MPTDPFQEAGLGYEHEPTPTVPADINDEQPSGETSEGKIVAALAMVALVLVAAGYVIAELMASGWSLLP